MEDASGRRCCCCCRRRQRERVEGPEIWTKHVPPGRIGNALALLLLHHEHLVLSHLFILPSSHQSISTSISSALPRIVQHPHTALTHRCTSSVRTSRRRKLMQEAIDLEIQWLALLR